MYPHERLRTPVALSYAGAFAIFLAGGLLGCEDLQPLNQLKPGGAFDPVNLDFGEIAVGTSARLPVDFKNTGPIAFTVTEIERAESFTMYGDGKSNLVGVTIAPGDTKTIDVEFLAMAEGEKKGDMIIRAGDLEVRLPVRGVGVIRRSPQIVVVPTSLDFGSVEVGGTGTRMFELKNNGNATGTLTGARLGSTGADVSGADVYRLEGLTFPVNIDEGQSVFASVSFHPSASGAASDRITFLGQMPQADVPLDLAGAGLETRGGLVCTPANIDFGRVQRGMPQSQTVNCEVRGGAVHFTSATIETGNTALFAVATVPPEGDLMPGQTIRFFVEFHPDGLPQRVQSSVAVRFTGANGMETLRIPLNGEVIPPPVTNTAISVVVRWDTNLTDVDTHLVRPGGRFFDMQSDCYFANMSPDWGTIGDTTDNPFLDVDDTDGRGPENVNLSRTAAGDYTVQIHYWNGFIPTRASVEVFIDGRSAGTFDRLIRCGDLWTVGTVNWTGTTGTFNPSTRVEASSEGPCGN